MARFRPYTIVCASLARLSHLENQARTAILEGYLRSEKVPYAATEGAYKGVAEGGFVIYGPRCQELAVTIIAAFDQETYLFAEQVDFAALWRVDGSIAATFSECKSGKGDFWTQIGNGAPFRWL